MISGGWPAQTEAGERGLADLPVYPDAAGIRSVYHGCRAVCFSAALPLSSGSGEGIARRQQNGVPLLP